MCYCLAATSRAVPGGEGVEDEYSNIDIRYAGELFVVPNA